MAIKKKTTKNKQKEQLVDYFPKGFWKDKLLPATLLVLLSLGLYAYSLGFDFVLDDGIVLAKNELVKKGIAGVGEILTTESFSGYFGGEQKDLLVGARYRPLSLISFALENHVFKDDPLGYHLLNILFYAITAILLYRTLFLLFPSQGKKWFWNIPFVATVLFITHPIHVEVVANIKSRDELYGLILSMTTLYLVLKYLSTKRVFPLIISGLTFWLALLAKENAATFLGVIPLTVYYFRKTNWKQIGVIMIPLILAFGIYFFMRYSAIGYIKGVDIDAVSVMNNPFKGMTVGERLATIFYTLLLYLKLLFFPHPLTHDYYPYQIPIMSWSKFGSIAGLVAYIGLGIVAVKGVIRKSKISYCIWFFLLTLFVVSNLIVPIGTFMNERFIYMPSVGFCVLIAIFLIDYLNRLVNKPILGYLLFGLIVLGFSIRTIIRIPDWKNGDTLNESSIKVSTNSARANLFYGNVLFQKGLKLSKQDEKKALFEEAKIYFEKAERILPEYNEPIRMLAGNAAELFNIDKDIDKLLERFYLSIQRNPRIGFIPTYLEYLNGKGQYIDELKSFYFTVGWTYLVNQRQIYDMGLKYLLYGHQVDPNDANIKKALGQTYLKIGDNANAAKYLN